MRQQIHPILAPVPGTARQIHSFHFGPEQAEGKIYIQASLHADELPGMLVAWHLKARLAELATAGIDAGIVDPVREMQIDPLEEGGDVGDHGIEGQKEGRYAFGWRPLCKLGGERVAEPTGLLIGAGDGIERDEQRDVGGRARQQPGAAFMKTVTAEEARKEGAAELNVEVATLLLQIGYVLCILLGQQDVEPLATIGAQCLGQWLRIE
jgi:hypothetical protein